MRRRIIQWGPFVLVALLCAVLVAVDTQLKRSDQAGFVPHAATWQVAATDLPQLWTDLEELPAFETLQENAPPFMHEGAVAIRKLTGIRPTPSRLRLWLGNTAVLAGRDTQWCLSVHPGVALRIVSLLHGFVAETPQPGIRRWGALAYGWRDGFLLISPAVDFLAATLQSGTTLPFDAIPPESLRLSWKGKHPGSLRLRAQPGLPFTLTFSDGANASNAPLHFTHGWPDAMAVLDSNNANSIAVLKTVLDDMTTPLLSPETRGIWETLTTEWWSAQRPPVPFSTCGNEHAWVVFAPEASEKDTGLRIGQRQYGCPPQSLRLLKEMDNARPYRWNDREGWLVLSSPYSASWSAAQDLDSVAWATDPTLVPQLLDAPFDNAVSAIFSLHIRWTPLMQQSRRLLLELAEQELIPGYNTDDVRESWGPWLDALGAWSRLVCIGTMQDKQLSIQGHLTTPDTD